MKNTEKLRRLFILGDIRERMGADDANDESFDDKINQMDNTTLIKEWCAWEIGDGTWWTTMKDMFDVLEKFDKEQE